MPENVKKVNQMANLQ